MYNEKLRSKEILRCINQVWEVFNKEEREKFADIMLKAMDRADKDIKNRLSNYNEYASEIIIDTDYIRKHAGERLKKSNGRN
jgi:hypothetical protein